jgi:Kef-type K+ transport system membrane component KefB/Trk K+ transport system NAD-binding subunit
MLFDTMFQEIAAILTVATLLGGIGLLLRQPLIVAMLAAGILVGPSGLGLVQSHDQIELLAHIGIALLLFVVGLKLDLHLIRTMGTVALATGLGQVLFTSVFGFFLGLGLGLAALEALYVAVALTFSSTIIIVKLLSDKGEIDALHGRIAIGFLIVQDIVVILVMIGLTAFSAQEAAAGWSLLWSVGRILSAGLGFLAAIALLMRYVLPTALRYLARSQELLLLFAIAWAIALATLGDALGFSKEVGAFLGGVSLASTPYREAISTRLVSLRDFLLVFFFLDLGSRLNLAILGTQLGAAAVLSLFVLVGNPLIVMVIMGYLGYRKRTGLLAGLTVAQISEFSLIFGALGVSLGHLSPDILGLITLVGLVTIGGSTYLILYSGRVYELLAPWLSIFERRSPRREGPQDSTAAIPAAAVILIGLGNFGSSIANHLWHRRADMVGIDYDPEVLEYWRQRGLPVFYADSGDPELLSHLPLATARLVVVTVRQPDLNLALLRALRQQQFRGKVALTARQEEDTRLFAAAGADIVLKPFADAAEQAATVLTAALDVLAAAPDGPVSLRLCRLKPASRFAGRPILKIPLRRQTGASIVAVSRGGQTFLDPNPDFTLFPGDRLVLAGDRQQLQAAAAFLESQEIPDSEAAAGGAHFRLATLPVAAASPLIDKTLQEVNFRDRYHVTVVGLVRDGAQVPLLTGQERLRRGDRLIVGGRAESVEQLLQQGSL